MLNLASTTRDRWYEVAAADLDEILLDHAHCEKKAASTAINLIFRYQQIPELMRPLSELAREELEHFELVLGHLEARGIPFRRQNPSDYAPELMRVVRPEEPAKLLDTLLCCALIEARSCERMQILAERLPDAELRELYAGLLASEARHHSTYLRIAESLFPRDEVRARLAEVADHEAAVVARETREPRVHS
ncbi:MAG: tRNA-(ms[2]io[6]A)-hydroxylase [Planctomycetota bacterium]